LVVWFFVKISLITDKSINAELNVKEIRPPRMDTSGRTKYPVLFRVYGGPGSQLVDVKFAVDWHHYLACSLQYIVVTVDGRGTGYKGRKLRNPVKGNLGFFETRDQIEAARIWADKPWVDRKRIGIWGWVSEALRTRQTPSVTDVLLVIWWLYELEGGRG
jgi:dipeptidyl aminopeptidase B